MHVAKHSPQPNVEKVREVGIRDCIVVWWVCNKCRSKIVRKWMPSCGTSFSMAANRSAFRDFFNHVNDPTETLLPSPRSVAYWRTLTEIPNHSQCLSRKCIVDPAHFRRRIISSER